MRPFGGWAIAAIGVAALPAAAQHGPPSIGDHLSADAARDAIRLPEALVPAQSGETSSAVSARFRVRTAVAVVPQGPLGARDRVHQRLTGSMIDFYPVDGRGFRVSAGSRFYDVRSAGAGQAAGPDAGARGLLAMPRTSTAGAKAVLQRSAPTLTMGYAGTVGASTSVGLELGAMKGRAYAGTADRVRQDGDVGKVNPVVSLKLGRRF